MAFHPWTPGQLWVAHPGKPPLAAIEFPAQPMAPALHLNTPPWWFPDGQVLEHVGEGRFWCLCEKPGRAWLHVVSLSGDIHESRELPWTEPAAAACVLSVSPRGEFLGSGQRLFQWKERSWQSVTLLDQICHLAAVEPVTKDPSASAGGWQLVAGLDQGAVLLGEEPGEQLPFALGLSTPCVTPGARGEVLLAATDVALVVSIRKGRAMIQEEWQHGMSELVALVASAAHHATLLVARDGSVCSRS